jgi:hypothetical protein
MPYASPVYVSLVALRKSDAVWFGAKPFYKKDCWIVETAVFTS